MKEDISQQEANTYMSIGMMTGIIIVATMMEEAPKGMTPRSWQLTRGWAASQLEELTGMPSEDASLMLDNVIKDVRSDLKKHFDVQ